MRLYPVLFWLAAIAVIFWNGWTYIGFAVVEFYHPFSARGDLLWSLKKIALLSPALLATGVFLLWLWQRPLKHRVYQCGIALLAVATVLPWLPKIDSDFRQEYWLAETRHDIPWQFAPFGGNSDPGGKAFLVRVSIPDLEPKYATSDPTVIVGKAVDLNSAHGGAKTPIEPCVSRNMRAECRWQRGDYIYSATGVSNLSPTDIADLKENIADLLDSFEIQRPNQSYNR